MMNRWIAALLAAGALLPGMAQAQQEMQGRGTERGWQRRGDGERVGVVPRPENRPLYNRREDFPENRPTPTRPDRPETRPDRAPQNWEGRNRIDRDDRDRRAERERERRDRQRNWDRQRGWDRSDANWRDFGDDQWRSFERREWGSRWNRGWREDGRYDWNRWRSANRNLYHLPRYYSPYGGNAGYRRFGPGAALDPIFFNQTYWLSDPFAYRLPPAYAPYRWVRYYNDALLVDIREGVVVDMVYDIFW